MCVNIEVVLPTIESFLLLHSLRCGSIVILFWTIFRTLFCVLFFSMAILELLVHEHSPFGAWLVGTDHETPKNIILILFYCYETLLICDVVLLIFTTFLGYGIYFEKSNLLKYYLICRFLTWVPEVLFTVILCLSDKLLIGYYLSILLFVVLEFYSFIVVYSYYASLSELEGDNLCKSENNCNARELREDMSFCNDH